jgi:hypothetical protein
MNVETLKSQTLNNFLDLIGYVPHNMILVKGWLVWILHSGEDVNKILQAQ